MHLALFKLGTEKNIQENMYVEIKRYMKSGQHVDESVLQNAKYTKAFLKEVFRLVILFEFKLRN